MTVYRFDDPALFASAELSTFLEERKRTALAEVGRLMDRDVISQSPEDLTGPILAKFRVKPIALNEGGITRDDEESDLPTSRVANGRFIYGDHQPTVAATKFSFFVPFEGTRELFQLLPNTYTLNHPHGKVVGSELVFTYKMIEPDAEALNAQFRNQLDGVKNWLRNQDALVEDFNRTVTARLSEAVQTRRDQLLAASKVSDSLGYPKRIRTTTPAVPTPPRSVASTAVRNSPKKQTSRDLFISHASEDKNDIARPLYEALSGRGVSVWFDEAVLELGDSLRRKIDRGLTECRYGVVILSPTFLAKEWPQRELDGLTARETASGLKAILPVWHRLDKETLMKYSPILADRLAARSEEGVEAITAKILKVLGQ